MLRSWGDAMAAATQATESAGNSHRGSCNWTKGSARPCLSNPLEAPTSTKMQNKGSICDHGHSWRPALEQGSPTKVALVSCQKTNNKTIERPSTPNQGSRSLAARRNFALLRASYTYALSSSSSSSSSSRSVGCLPFFRLAWPSYGVGFRRTTCRSNGSLG